MEDKKALSQEGQQNIIVGHVYKENNSAQEVIPFFVDVASAQVRFAPVGRSTEDTMRTSDFLNRFTYAGPVSERAEDQKSNEQALEDMEQARKDNENTPKTGN